MANPSLQIGNNNWAIKEDNLLGYSTAGTRFVPQPITMTRATLGTRVNPSGLVEDVELLGSELVTNGDFATDSSWIKGTGWSIAGGNATLAVQAASSSLSSNTMSVTVGKLYKITINVSATSSGFRLYDSLGVVSYGLPLGESVFYRTPSSSIYTVTPLGLAGASGIVTSVSVKEYQANDLARVDYTDGTSSLLVEPQRRNLVTYSESISNLSSNTNGTGTFTITNNYTDSPEGVQNASRVQMSIVDTDDTNNYKLINTGSVMTTGVTREISFYAKSLTGSNQDVLVYWSYDQQIVTLTNDWQRFKISATSSNSGSVFIGTRGGSGSYFSGGDANLDFALWGYQIEDDGSGGGSSYATSYIPTSGDTVTRNQETYTKTGISDKINSTEGVLFIEMAALSDNDGTYRSISISDSSRDNEIEIDFTNDEKIRVIVKSGGGTIFSTSFIIDTTLFNKVAVKYKLNDFAVFINGTEEYTLTSGAIPIGLNRLAFDRGDGGTPFYAKVKQLQVFKTALSDSELATLTT